MSTVESAPFQAVYSNDAMELLDCFAVEFDELLCRLAQQAAAERTTSGNEVVLTGADIAAAAERLLSVLRAPPPLPKLRRRWLRCSNACPKKPPHGRTGNIPDGGQEASLANRIAV